MKRSATVQQKSAASQPNHAEKFSRLETELQQIEQSLDGVGGIFSIGF